MSPVAHSVMDLEGPQNFSEKPLSRYHRNFKAGVGIDGNETCQQVAGRRGEDDSNQDRNKYISGQHGQRPAWGPLSTPLRLNPSSLEGKPDTKTFPGIPGIKDEVQGNKAGKGQNKNALSSQPLQTVNACLMERNV